MADRNINEYLESGDAKNINVGEYLRVGKTMLYASVPPDGDGLFLRLGFSGEVVGYRAKDQDLSWSDSRTSSVDVSDTEVVLAEVTPDHDVSIENGSYAFTCKVDNDSVRAVELTLRMKVNGVEKGSNVYEISGRQVGYPVSFWGNVTEDIASGSAISITAQCTNDVIVRGDLSPTVLKVTEAQAAPVTVDGIITIDGRINREKVMGDAGVASIVGRSFYALVSNGSRAWTVFYDKKSDTLVSSRVNILE